jgi:hypothetical protein
MKYIHTIKSLSGFRKIEFLDRFILFSAIFSLIFSLKPIAIGKLQLSLLFCIILNILMVVRIIVNKKEEKISSFIFNREDLN